MARLSPCCVGTCRVAARLGRAAGSPPASACERLPLGRAANSLARGVVLGPGRRLERESPAGAEVERLRRRPRRWPGVMPTPAIGARLEHECLWMHELAGVFEVELEERHKDLL